MVQEDSALATFSGQTTVTVEPGQEAVSDLVTLNVEAFSALVITFFLVQGDSLIGHLFAQQTSYISGMTDKASISPEIAFLAYPLQTNSW
jgi:hypothetical protein